MGEMHSLMEHWKRRGFRGRDGQNNSPQDERISKSAKCSPRQHQQAEILKQRIDAYADKIINPATPTRDKDFLKSKMKNDLEELKFLVSENNSKSVMEAINKLPLSSN